MKKRIIEFTASAAVYCAIELAARGYTHWTMALTGGLCGVALFTMNDMLPQAPVWALGILGSAFITYTELCVGATVNIALGWKVWNYANRWGNIAGQICPLFSLAWFILSCAVIWCIRHASLFFKNAHLD